jgi:hypothetical protein|mmetsp:Transcript_52906/g.84069  ORF Transcript_52906/g.84069 Transcript_52906/m.84069 type:complete len:495 (+) Transcript_52906:73-1557(+)
MAMNVFNPNHGGIAQVLPASTQSDAGFTGMNYQWNACMEMDGSHTQGTFFPQPQPVPQSWTNTGPVSYHFMMPVGQTPQGALMFASVAPPSNPVAFAKNTPCFAQNEECQQTHADKADAEWKPRREEDFFTRRSRNVNPSSDALTSAEIDEMRLAVQKTMRKLQNPSSSESFGTTRPDDTHSLSASYFSKPKECDNDSLSTSSSVGMLDSLRDSSSQPWTMQSLPPLEDDDTHSPRRCFVASEKTADDLIISDSDVNNMFFELECPSPDRRKKAIEWVVSYTRPLAFTRRGCRIVQRVMELATAAEKQQMVMKLEGFALEALQSPHANYVLQKCFEIVPTDEVQFVLNELKGQGAFVARHRFGCRVVQRALENCSSEQTQELIAEILLDANQLVRHTYGNFVIQHVLQYGTSEDVHEIAKVLLADVVRFAKHRIASHVMSCALSCCSPGDVQSLTKVLGGEEGQMADLMRRQYGSFVAREVNRVNGRSRDTTKD